LSGFALFHFRPFFFFSLFFFLHGSQYMYLGCVLILIYFPSGWRRKECRVIESMTAMESHSVFLFICFFVRYTQPPTPTTHTHRRGFRQRPCPSFPWRKKGFPHRRCPPGLASCPPGLASWNSTVSLPIPHIYHLSPVCVHKHTHTHLQTHTHTHFLSFYFLSLNSLSLSI
jgi:hypothetical protein